MEKDAALLEAIHSLNWNICLVLTFLVILVLSRLFLFKILELLLIVYYSLESKSWVKPKHLGIIMDGNRRFAKDKGVQTGEGHKKGSEKLKDVIRWCYDMDVRVLTVWAFSTENFSRDKKEVDDLFNLMSRELTALKDHEVIRKHQVKVNVIGEKQFLPEFLLNSIQQLEMSTAHYTNYIFNIAIAYGGREELGTSFRNSILQELSSSNDLQQIRNKVQNWSMQESIESINKNTYFSNQPEVDLILRTSGEKRLSGFMLWNCVHSELYFVENTWPNFSKLDFLKALKNFNQRDRRFGK